MNREITKRDKTILGIIAFLVLIGLAYYYLFLIPNSEKIDYYNSLSVKEQAQLDTIYTKAANMKKMTAYIESAQDTTQVMPAYDNITNVYLMLYDMLKDTTYSLSFSGVTTSGYIAKRVVGISYTAGSYAEAREVIDRFYDCEYLSQISNVSFSVSSPCSVSLSVTFYEVVSD